MDLLERILKQNIWWQHGKIEEIQGLKKRYLMQEIISYLANPQILAILGLRRTGKTTLLKQIIETLAESTNPKRILYFSFDEILGKDPDIIEKLLEIYENEILRSELKEVYIFFDEINHIKDWQVILKRYYDLNRQIKFFVSGSSSIHLNKAKESLAGRIYDFELPPLSFKEYLYLKNIFIKNTKLESLALKKEFNRYLLSGSLPEIMNEDDFSKIKKYITSVTDKIIFHDIPKVYPVDEPEALNVILSLISQKPGMILEYQSLSKNLKLSYQTVSKYVGYLEKAYLIKKIYNFRGSPLARERKLKKAYLGSVILGLGFMDSEHDFMQNISFLAENLVCLHLDAKWFWKKNNEIDFYHDNLPIEVKYGDSKANIKPHLLAAKELKSENLLVITKDYEEKKTEKGINIDYVPLWKWLL